MIDDIPDLTYAGNAQTPDISVHDGEVTLGRGTDYTVDYSNNINAGTATATITGKGNYRGTVTKDFVIKKDDLKIKGGKSITANNITYGDNVSRITLNDASFVGATAGTDVQGRIIFDHPDQLLNAGAHTVGWRFVPNSDNYNEYTGSVQVTVKKRDPAVNTNPSAVSGIYHPSLTLGNIDIRGGSAEVPGSWSWVNSAQKLTVPGGSYACRFTPSDTANYDTTEVNIGVVVTRATPHLASVSAEAITYGQTLSDSAIGFRAQYSETDETPIDGEIGWVDGSTKPNVNDSNKTEYEVEFKPSDTDNYSNVTIRARLFVDKADRPGILPKERYEVPYSIKELTNDILTDASGWAFSGSDVGTLLDAGREEKFTAIYIAEDRFNFNNTEMETTVLRKNECHHDGEKVIRGERAATCMVKGYTGDEYCLNCDEMTKRGDETEIDSDNHVHTSIIPGREATYDSEGLTEGERCDECKRIIREQQVIPKLARPEPQDPDPVAGLSSSEKAAVYENSRKLNITVEQALEISDFAKRSGISRDALLITDEPVTKGNTDADMKGSTFRQLQACAKKNTRNTVTLKWKKVPKANGYRVYGSKCGRNNKMKLLKTFTSNNNLSFTQKKLRKGTYYKYIVIAYRNIGGRMVTIYASPTIHSITKGGKKGVAKSVKVIKVGRKKGAKATVGMGKTTKIVAKEIKEDRPIRVHRKLSYETSNVKIATVSKSGVVKGVGRGSCKIYVYAQNGRMKAVSIKVK